MLELKHINKYYNAGTVNEMCLFEDFNLTIRTISLCPWLEATAPAKPHF